MTSYLIRNKISLLVCDMGGTTVNESGLIYKSLFNTLSKLGYNPCETDVSNWTGLGKRHVLYSEIYKKTFPQGCHDISWRVDEAEKCLFKELTEQYFNQSRVELIDENLLDLFDRSRMNGIKVALNTEYPKSFQNTIIAYFNLDKHIDAFISSEEVKYGRPYPYMIHNLMEQFDIVDSKHVVKVGDTINDMKEGENAHCGVTVGVLSGYENKETLLNSGADVVVNKITDLNDSDDLPIFLL
jgi:phosphonatase-like hydrolase